MDLYAYAQIETLDQIAKNNGIEVPRLRGYRLMKNEETVTKEEINKLMKECAVGICEDLCCAEPFWNGDANCRSYSAWTDYLEHYYLVTHVDDNGHEKYVDIRWDRIHGWKRKVLKFEIKKKKRRIKEQFDLWNKYVGREDVLYIHSRIGGGNWDYYNGDELKKKDWFLDKIDDCFDGTYCDIYALIK